MNDEKTLCNLFWSTVQKHGQRPAQEWFDGEAWVERTYQAFGEAVRDVAHGLMALGLRKGDRVAVWSRNHPRWTEVDFANQTAGFVTVPIYDTLTGDIGAYILDDAGAKVLFVQDNDILDRVWPVRGKMKGVKTFVLLEGSSRRADVITYDAFVKEGQAFGRDNPDKLNRAAGRIQGDDLASLVYTSGTTGEPKGVMLTHRNFATNADAMHLVDVSEEDVFLSFLPLSHVFERTGGHFGAYGLGAKVVFARSIETLTDDMQHARPTIMMSVPRLYEKIYSRIQDSVKQSSFLKRMIFDWAINVGRAANVYHQRGEPLPKSLAGKVRRADHLVFGKLKARVGGRLRFFVSGGAALSREIEEFFWAAGIHVLQGYGLTETSPVCNVNTPDNLRFGSVGKTIPDVQIRIDTSEWQSASGKEGEICFKGPNIMQGYWNNDKATKEVFDKEGWFHTGDIGYVDDDGFLFITDRKKEILVMSNGKNVAPQPIENHLKLQPHIAQACIVGDKRKYISALLVPDWEALDAFCLKNGIATDDKTRLVADSRVVSLFEGEVESVNAHLPRYEQVKKFWVVPADWTVESGELTPSLKLKRRIIHDRFAQFIEGLYPKE